MTKEQVLAIQKGGIDWFGQPLKQDGDYGPRTQWWHGITGLDPMRQEIIRIALGYHAADMKEATGNNDGEFVDMLLKPAGLRRQPWCIAFTSHCYRKAGLAYPTYFTSAWQIITWAEKNEFLVDEPLPGDIFAFLYPKKPGDKQWKGHGGIVLGNGEIEKKPYIADVDGNITNCVRVGRRLITPGMKFIRNPQLDSLLQQPPGRLTMPNNLSRLDALGDR